MAFSDSSPVPTSRLVEGSEFLNEEDSTKDGMVSSLNGKSNQWSFEELIDTNIHSKTRPLIESEDRNQVLIHCDGSSDGTRVAFEEKGTPISTLHSSNQPIEAMSGEASRLCFTNAESAQSPRRLKLFSRFIPAEI